MSSDLRAYILGCLRCAEWAVAARQVPLSPIQVYQPYDLFGIDFVDWAEASIYGYRYILNMVDYFSGAIFPFPTMGTTAGDVKQALKYYQSGHHPLPSAVYCDPGSAFISMEMKEAVNELGIIYVIAPSQSHKSVGMIERANRILRSTMNKMKIPGEDFIDLLRRAAPACNERHIEHLGYSPSEILHGIDPTPTAVRSIQVLAIPEKVVLPSAEDMMPLVWDHMARREEQRKDVVQRTRKAKQRMKERYDRGVIPREFTPGQFVFLRDTNLIYDKNVPRWRGPFVISGYAGEHRSSYKLKRLDGSRAPNSFHGDHLRIFNAREGYLRPANEEELTVVKNLRKQRKKILNRQQARKKRQESSWTFKPYVPRPPVQ